MDRGGRTMDGWDGSIVKVDLCEDGQWMDGWVDGWTVKMHLCEDR